MNANMTDAMVDHHALRRPDDVALVDDDGVTSYRELAEAVHATAHVLLDHGVTPGDRVALFGRNSRTYMQVALAAWKIGAVLVPVNFRFQADELRHLLDHADVRVAVVELEFMPLVERVRGDVGSLKTVLGLDGSTVGVDGDLTTMVDDARGVEVPTFPAPHDHLHRIMYTSGTTSRPKGVMYTHGMVAFNVLAQTRELALTAADRVLVSSPLYHVAAMDAPGLSVLYHGGRLVIMRKFEPRTALRLIAEHGVTGGIMVQTMLHMLREASAEIDVDSLRFLIFGAASGELYRELRERFPTTHLVQAYGLTEGCSAVTYMDARHAVEKFGTTGSTVPFVDVRVVDVHDADVPPGTEGEILLRGAKVTPGYWRDPSPEQSLLDGGWVRTGDIGVLDEDGYLAITDRKKDMIRSGGENVASQEIERVVYEHAGVLECAVVAAADERWGEVPRVFVVAKSEHAIGPDDLIEHCKSSLAGFKVPRYVEFVAALPRNASGKVLKTQLRDMPLSERAGG